VRNSAFNWPLAHHLLSGTYHLENAIDKAEGALPDWLINIIDYLKKEGVLEPFILIRPWAQTQFYRLYDQLVRGIRFFDIRIVWDGKVYVTSMCSLHLSTLSLSLVSGPNIFYLANTVK